MYTANQELRRGPRLEAAYAAKALLPEINQDRDKSPLKAEGFPRIFPALISESHSGFTNHWLYLLRNHAFKGEYKGQVGDREARGGIVQKVKKQDGGVLVEFKPVTWKEAIVHCKETNKIDGIADDGRLIYRSLCKDTGKKSTQSYTEPAVWIPAVLAEGIEPGTMIRVDYDQAKTPHTGVPIVVWTDKDAKKAVAVYGFTGKFKADPPKPEK
jgi:hypothetical protein